MTNATAKFELGKTYNMRFIGDSDLRPEFVCVKLTAKTATFQGKHEKISKRIKVYDGVEYVLAGSYSMAPSIKAA
tara:strand:- start:811 stop:1035 length:225 start_codon:yes stop_codon:yes gene_type:complete